MENNETIVFGLGNIILELSENQYNRINIYKIKNTKLEVGSIIETGKKYDIDVKTSFDFYNIEGPISICKMVDIALLKNNFTSKIKVNNIILDFSKAKDSKPMITTKKIFLSAAERIAKEINMDEATFNRIYNN